MRTTYATGFCECRSLLAIAHDVIYYSFSCPSSFKFIPGNQMAVEKDPLSKFEEQSVKAPRRQEVVLK